MPEVLVALGSNVGDPLSRLRDAVEALSTAFDLAATSAIYQTAPMYVTDQPEFLNAAVAVRTNLGPLPVLHTLKSLEQEIGRKAGRRFGPREIDLDLIAYGGLRYRFTEKEKIVLEVPHPRIVERRFVLAPLSDLDPDLVLPGLGSVRDLLHQTNDQAGSVQRIEDALLPV